jgi:hypothetical protein
MPLSWLESCIAHAEEVGEHLSSRANVQSGDDIVRAEVRPAK